MTEYEACYVFRPRKSESLIEATPPPNKRRKINKPLTATISEESEKGPPFVPLLSGTENLKNVKVRRSLFNQSWGQRQNDINKIFLDSNSDAIVEIVSFILAAETISTTRKIPSGLVVAGPNFSTHSNVFGFIEESVKHEQRVLVVNLDSSQVPNLKSALKYINRIATTQESGSIEGDIRQSDSRYLNYDLQILYDYVQDRSISKVILSLQDSEAFQSDLLAELIDVLSSWNDRIPFVLLFGIATSVNMFQEKLSRATIRHLQSVRFDVAQLDTEDLFKKALHSNDSRHLWLGPGLSKGVIQRHKFFIQSVSAFSRALKYIYMTHFFANPLTIFLEKDVSFAALQSEHYEAVRNLKSFRRIAEAYLEEGNYQAARKLFDNNAFLHDTILSKLEENQKNLQNAIQAVDIIFEMQSSSGSKANTPWSELYISAMSGELQESTSIKDILLSIRKMPSNAMRELLAKISHFQIPDLAQTLDDLETLMTKSENSTAPLHSEHDTHHQTLRTTVVAQRVELSKNTLALSQQDLAYSKIVNRVDALLKTFFKTSLVNPQDLFLHEILIFDFKSPYRDAFAPKPRLAVERALSSPHDYLGCDCCEGIDNALSATQPATAVLYQLYVESGAVINIADLWSAFYAIVGKEDCEDEEGDQQRVLALFSQGLAELKYLGMIKTSRKKADHLTKLLWKGL